VNGAYKPGKQALKGEHRALIECPDPRRFKGSIDLDAALAGTSAHRSANRWDYGIGLAQPGKPEAAIWVEVHPGAANDVDTVLKKLSWLKNWLQTEARELNAVTCRAKGARCFFWLATGAPITIRAGMPQARKLQGAGLDLPQRKLVLA